MKREKPRHPRNLIGRSVRQLRRAHALTHEALCGRVAKYGVTLSRTQMAKIEAGIRPVFDYEALALAKAFRVPLTALVK